MKSIMPAIVFLGVGAVIGGYGTYLYMHEDACQLEQVSDSAKYLDALVQRVKRLEEEKTVLQRESASHKQQEEMFYAQARDKSDQIHRLRRQMLYQACRYGDVPEVRTILEADHHLATEPTSLGDNENWLHSLARRSQVGSGRLAEVFLDFGVDRDVKNTKGQKPIDIAKSVGSYDIENVLSNYKSKEVIRIPANDAP